MKIKLLPLLCGILLISTAKAQSFQMVKDLYPQTESLLYDYDAGMTYFNGKLYFTTYYGDIATSDGTTAGTEIISNLGMVKMTYFSFQKNRFIPLKGKLYYKNHKHELCVTDGTSAGTTVIADIHPTDETTNYGVITLLGANDDKLFFVGNNGTSGHELWVSDGTAAGTQQIADFVSGAVGLFTTNTKQHIGTVIGNKLYFFADNKVNGFEAWVSDGTASGTNILVDSNPNGHCSYFIASALGGYGSNEMKFFPFNGAVYFVAYNGIYKTNGTATGTTLAVSGTNYGADRVSSVCVFNNALYFNQSQLNNTHLLLKSDGTLAGTSTVATLSGAMSRGFQEFNGELYFRCKPNGYNSSDKDYIAKLTYGTQADSITRTTAGFFNYPTNIIHSIGNDFLYFGDYMNHAIYRYNNGANTQANTDFTSVYENLLSTPIGTFAIGTNSSHGYELWKWENTNSGFDKQINAISLHPTLATHTIRVHTDEAAPFHIYDMEGRNIGSRNLNVANNTIDVSTLRAGVYFLRNDQGASAKFIKK